MNNFGSGKKKEMVLYRIYLAIIAFAILTIPSFSPAATLQELQQQKQQLQQQIEANQKAAQTKEQEAKQLQSNIAQIDTSISTTEQKIKDLYGQIEQTTNEINQTFDQINKKEEELKIQRENLSYALVEMYEMANKSTWEIILGSNSLSDVITYTEYIDTLELKIENTIAEMNKIKAELEQKKKDLEAKRTSLEISQKQKEAFERGLQVQRVQKENMKDLAIVTAEQARQQAKEAEKKLGSVDAAIRAALARSGNKSVGYLTGKSVSTGTTLGFMGSTGNSTGPHLHLEVRQKSGYSGDGNIYDFLDIGYGNTSNPVSNCSIGMNANDLAYNFGLSKPMGNPRYVTACWGSGGYGDDDWHGGVDMVEYSGAPIFAAKDGTVVFHGDLGGWGNAVVIYHGGGLWTLYGHMLG